MRGRIVFTVLMVIMSAGTALRGQYVTLQGRSFMLNGQERYPRVMNFSFQFASNTMNSTDPDDIMVSVERGYDYSVASNFEHTDQAGLRSQMQLCFAKLVSMGFNTIRATGLLPLMRWDSPGGQRYYTIRVVHTATNNPAEYSMEMDPLSFTDPVSAKYFELVRIVLEEADSAGLKVILLCADDTGHAPGAPNQLTLATDQEAVELYASYLSRLGDELKEETGLMAYDIWNEPIWTNYDVLITALTKSDVCAYTTLWYDAIHEHDENHLITLGGSSYDDLQTWDPAMMKIDFYSPHVYEIPTRAQGYDVQNAIERVVAHLYWLGKELPMPWLIGETGFSAENDEQDPLDFFTGPDNQHLDAVANGHHQMPWMMGNESDQATFAQTTMDATRNYMGSGYSWWGFQNTRGANLNSSPGDYRGNWWGLLKFGNEAGLGLAAPFNVENHWRDKLTVSTMTSYSLPPAPMALPAPPGNYYNWYEWTGPVVHSGVIQAQNGVPVDGAIVSAGWRYQPDGSTIDDEDHYEWDHLPTTQLGYFEIRRPLQIEGLHNPTLDQKWAVSTGADRQNLQPSGQITTLSRSRLEYSDVVDDEVIVQGDVRRFSAWNDLAVSNTLIGWGTGGGIAEFVARQEIHVTDEFHAEPGSEVHIHTAPTFPACVPAQHQMVLTSEPPPDGFGSAKQMKGRLELQFQPLGLDLSIFPNPASSQLSVAFDAAGGWFTIVNVQGEVVSAFRANGPVHIVDVSGLASGPYVLRILADGLSAQTQFNILR